MTGPQAEPGLQPRPPGPRVCCPSLRSSPVHLYEQSLTALGSTDSQPTFQACPPSHREPSDLFIFVIILDFKSKDGLLIFDLMRPTQRGQISSTRNRRVSYY